MTGVRSLTNFRRNRNAALKWMKRTGRPLSLTYHGRPAVVLQDNNAYEKLMKRVVTARAELAQPKPTKIR